MALKEYPVWREGVAFPAIEAGRELPARADVAVVGAGYTGLAAARELARRGASVAVFEAQSAGWGASSRNGGMVLSGLKLDVGELARRYGLPAARQMFAASLAAIDCVEQIVREEAIDCAFERAGHLRWPVARARLRRGADLLAREFGHRELLAAGDLRAGISSPIYHGGMIGPRAQA